MKYRKQEAGHVLTAFGLVAVAGAMVSPLVAIAVAVAIGFLALLLLPELGVAYVGYLTVLPALPLFPERLAPLLVVISGCGALVKYHFSPIGLFVRRCGPALLLLGFMGLRALIDGDDLYAQAWFKEALLVALVTFICVNGDGGRVVRWLALFGVASIVLNYVLGSTTAAGVRWAGLAGNPNKLGFFVVISVPFIATLARRRSVTRQTMTLLAAVIGAGAVVLRTVSIQSSVILLLAAGLTAMALPTLNYLYADRLSALKDVVVFRRIIQLGAFSLILYLLGAAMVRTIIDLRPNADIDTFSGRSSTWAAGLDALVKHPVLGVGGEGRIDVTTLVADPSGRSIPNTALSICVQAGFFAALLGLVLVVALARSAVRTPGSVVSIALYVVVLFSMVQAIQLYDLTWIVVGLTLGVVAPAPIANQKPNRSRPPTLTKFSPS